MCGIGGIVQWDGGEPRRSDVAALVRAQCHRGPDGDGIWISPGVALAHNRLAIIDLVTGQQPMLYANGRYALTYNGELYNFRELKLELERDGAAFRTASDTEVILAAYERWGERCVERFRGMFAFAIWDGERRSLFVARDRIGIKPLYYCHTSHGFAFASELQGLLSFAAIDQTLDLGALDLYLHYQYVPAPYTIYSAVRKLEPAHSLLLSADRPTPSPREYWRPTFEPDRSVKEEEWLEQIDHVIGQSVKAHLVSDVPFGTFLSGGIDSSLVAYHMSRHMTQPVRAFTIGFDEATYDETAQAAAVARAVGADHTIEVVHVNKYDVLDDLIYKLARHYGEPFADSSAIPTYCVSAVARASVKMVLSGDGGDELFAGYNTYPAILGAVSAPRSWFRRLTGGTDDLRSRALAAPTAAALAQHAVYYAHFRDDARRSLYRSEVAAAVGAADRHECFRQIFERAGAADTLSALQYLDLKTYLPGDILAKVDVASMAHSLEVRVPLLDHHVIELAGRIPPEMKLFAPDGSLQQKYLLKKYANRVLPGDAFSRPKHGFGVPIHKWFSGDLYSRVHERLTATSGILDRLFAPQARAALVATPRDAEANAPRIWSLLMLDAWSTVCEVSHA